MKDHGKSADVMRQIDENLRRVYDQTTDEAIPERFQKLLEKLKEQDSSI
jgi:hemerythrin-like domain-containing protein